MTTLQAQAMRYLQLNLSDEQATAFERFARELADWNQRMNLTSITDPDEVRVKHFLDSLSLAKFISFDDGDRVIDVGTGAGLPGLALAILFPQIHVTLNEATAKKLRFCQYVIKTLGLKNVDTLHARAEQAGQMPDHRAQYDVAVARAVARLPALLEYLLPLVKIDGLCVAMKGESAYLEADDSATALDVLGGMLEDIVPVDLPGIEDPHNLVVVSKTRATPAAYPRRAGIPTRQPIE
jgi:16S rRNA (guanine527-N7)-methyltransferase